MLSLVIVYAANGSDPYSSGQAVGSIVGTIFAMLAILALAVWIIKKVSGKSRRAKPPGQPPYVQQPYQQPAQPPVYYQPLPPQTAQPEKKGKV